MKKRSRIVSLGVLALTLTMMSTCLMGATMARYVTEVTGSATAAVAAWSFKANGETSTLTAIDLGADGKREAYNENNIMKGVVAPGTKGSFDIVIDGTGSEVGIEYAVTIAEGTNVTLPDDLVFSTEAITADKPGSKLDVFSPSGTIAYASGDNSMEKTITVNWEWPFDATDDKESNDNAYVDKDWTLNITITGKQIDPNKTTTTE
ncbi:hypothetical protein [Enterocloster lavalensis]|uniref:hypothetical protein n=1 Tax=Enterocloster lavalensis TaxID=460384 RepID=UPI001D05E518|nr:hypothetical protein [Enterocloster lavalensis]MCB6346064.1 hypothetical protein [Enterocloster lavalensis]